MADKSSTGNPLEQFVLLAKTAKGHAAVGLVKQALEASNRIKSSLILSEGWSEIVQAT